LSDAATDSIFWVGLAPVPARLLKLQTDVHVEDPGTTLVQIVESQSSVSISKLTIDFVLCFLALRESTLDIKGISRYLSRETGRHKSTLCKLYQISHILEAAGIIERSPVLEQFAIVAKYFALADLTGGQVPDAIRSILNGVDEGMVVKRRNDFQAEIERVAATETNA
jgi:hypothetical protein